MYNSKCPIDRPASALYLKPLQHPKEDVWYQKVAVGHNTLSKVVNQLMASAGIPGHFANHSLRSTATTRLFNAHVDEQLIIMRTGHSNTMGVRAYMYKCASDQLLEETSDILNRKKIKSDLTTSDSTNQQPLQTLRHLPLSEAVQSLANSINVASSTNVTFNFNITN
jgi:hypothetical protein